MITLAFFDAETEFLNKLVDYIGRNNTNIFRIVGFSNEDSFRDYEKNNEIELLIVGAEKVNNEIKKKYGNRLIILYESRECIDEQHTYIYKYQNIKLLFKKILQYASENIDIGNIPSGGSNKAELIGIYTPQGGTSQTEYGIGLARELSEKSQVLYICLREFSMLDYILGKNSEETMSDLLYSYMSGNNLNVKLSSISDRAMGFEYISPCVYERDLRNTKSKIIIDMIEEIALSGQYSHIIMDLSNILENVYECMEYCDKVHIPYTSQLENKQGEMFMQYLNNTERKELCTKIKMIFCKKEYENL